MALGPGTRLGSYEILLPLGAGGMGEVYRAKDLKLGRSVAIKVLPDELASDPERLTRFEREARTTSALNHPNIVTIHDIDEHEGTHYIAMELVEGKTLRELVGETPLSMKELLPLATQMADGLTKAHEAGIVHRDLKPENMMVTDDGLIKILDFGLAKSAPQSAEAGSEMPTVTKATQHGVILGTVPYMSPEQASGRRLDFHSDQFSLGSILYEMATGTLAFGKATMPQTLAAIIEGEPEPIAKLNDEVPVELAVIVERCLNKAPEDRYDSTGELASELKNVPESVSPWRARRHFLWAAAGALATIVVLTLGPNPARLWESLSGDITPAPIESIAVLPLRNLSGDPEQDYFADGMTEALITDLAKIGALKVISRSSAMRYKGTDKPLSEIASELDVDAVVEGSALRAGDQVRIMAQLIRPETGEALWAESYEGDLRNVLVLQSEVARAIAGEIEVAVTLEESERLASARPVDPEAHEAYLRGIFHWQKLTRQNLDAALSYFQLALEKDPNYALAYVGIGRVWAGRSQFGFVPAREALPLEKAAVLKALELDESLAEAYSGLAIHLTWREWDWPSAKRAFERAIELNPNYSEARAFYSHFLNIMGHPDEAMVHIERALELDPFNALYHALYGVNLSFVGRHDDAIAQFREALTTTPDFPLAQRGLILALHSKGMYDEALAAKKSQLAMVGDVEGEEALMRGEAEGGYAGAMRRLAETYAARTPTRALQVAINYFKAGENDLALEWWERAFADHDPDMPYLGSALYESLRDDPRYRDLLRRMNLPEG